MLTDNPIVSVDAKKRELIGDLYRAGEVYIPNAIESTGKIICNRLQMQA